MRQYKVQMGEMEWALVALDLMKIADTYQSTEKLIKLIRVMFEDDGDGIELPYNVEVA